MIVIAGEFSVKPESRAEAVAACQKMARATQLETGCIIYKFYVDLEDDCLLHIFEEWESAEALAAHFQTPHMAEFRQLIPKLSIDGARSIKRYDVALAEPL